MKNVIICVLMIIIINTGLANSINEYTFEIVAEINTGEKGGEIGWDENLAEFWQISSQTFFINKENNINVYTINFSFVKTIPGAPKSGLPVAKKIIVDEKENIIGLSISGGLAKQNNSGELLFSYEYKNLPSKMKGKKEFFVFDGDVIYFDNNENLIIIDSETKIKKEFLSQQAIEKYNKKPLTLNEELLTNLRKGSDVKIKKFIINKKLLVIDNILYTGRFEKFKEYSEEILELSKNKISSNYQVIFNEVRDNSFYLITHDSDGNSYWEGRAEKQYNKGNPKQKVILVYSKYGEILDCFYSTLLESSVAVAPNGDVYFRENIPTDGKFLFYKVTRRWSPLL